MRRAIGIVVAAVIVMAPTSAHAAFPGANGKIAFTDDTDSDGELLAVQTATPGGPFSTSIAFAQRPAWAPDGTKLAFEPAWCCEVEVAVMVNICRDGTVGTKGCRID